MREMLAGILYKKSEAEKYGKRTVVCNSLEEFEKAIEGIACGLVSPGGTGLPRSFVEKLEKDGLIRVYRVLVDDKDFDNTPSLFRFLVPSREVHVYIPVDDIEKVRQGACI